MINVTTRALAQCRKILQAQSLDRFELGLKSGGCVGFQYHFEPVSASVPIPENDEIVTLDQLQFQICGRSQMYLIGTTIDWETSIMEQKFTFDNPLSKQHCGCGTSFQF